MTAGKRLRRLFGYVGIYIWLAHALVVQADGGKTEMSPNEPANLYAQSAVLMDAESGRVLFEKNGSEVRPMASTTKIMTLILALELSDPEATVTVSEYAERMPDVQLHIRKGEQYKLLALLHALMLESHNDVAGAVAEHVALSMREDVKEQQDWSVEESKQYVADFASLMNAKARDIGCLNTHFVTPNGLDGEDEGGVHATTAEDICKILRYCILQSPKKELFLEITGTPSYTFTDMSGKRTFTVSNRNTFLTMMEGAITGKTGYTSGAGYCYVGAVRQGETTLIGAVLACGWPNHKNYKWSDMRKLMEYGFKNYTYSSWEHWDAELEGGIRIEVEGGQGTSIGEPVYVRALMEKESDENEDGILLRNDEEISVSYSLRKPVSAPIKEGDVLGSVCYRVGDDVVRKRLLLAEHFVLAVDWAFCVRQVMQLVLL